MPEQEHSQEIEAYEQPASALVAVTDRLASLVESGDWRMLPATTEHASELIEAVIREEDAELVEASAPSEIERITERRQRIAETTADILGMVRRGDLPDTGEVYDMLDLVAAGREDRSVKQLMGTQGSAKLNMTQVRAVMKVHEDRGQYIHVKDIANMQEFADQSGLQLTDVNTLCVELGLDASDETEMGLLGTIIERIVVREHESLVEAIVRESEFSTLADQAE